MWHFKELTEAQKHQRRQLLDYYALVSQLSILVPLLLIGLIRLIRQHSSHPSNLTGPTPPSSPYLKAARPSTNLLFLRQTLNRVSFWLSWRVTLFQIPTGYTIGQLLLTAAWTTWLSFLCVIDTQTDYLHLTKRLGSIAAAQLPLHYLLATKSPYNPIALITGQPWERLNAYHQLHGRVISVFFYGHAILYLNFFRHAAVLLDRLGATYVQLGLLGVVMFAAIGWTSLACIRKQTYKLFLAVHVGLSVALLPVLWWHVHHVRLYVVQTAVVIVVAAGLRLFATVSLQGTLRSDAADRMLVVSVPRAQWSRSFDVGQHVYLSVGSAFSHLPIALGRNPFTIASLPDEDTLRLIVKQEAGATKRLHKLSKDADVVGLARDAVRVKLHVEGPYGKTTHLENLRRCSSVLLIAGGVGASFIVPLVRALMISQSIADADDLDGSEDYGRPWSGERTSNGHVRIHGMSSKSGSSVGERSSNGRRRSRSQSISSPFRQAADTPHRTGRIKPSGMLAAPSQSTTASLRRRHSQRVKLVWIVRHASDLAWALDELREAAESADRKVSLYITRAHEIDGNVSSASGAGMRGSPERISHSAKAQAPSNERGEYDVVEMQTLLGKESEMAEEDPDQQAIADDHALSNEFHRLAAFDPTLFDVQLGRRPHMGDLVDEAITAGHGAKTGVYVCGPAGMGEEVKKILAGHVLGAGRDVVFWNETFGVA